MLFAPKIGHFRFAESNFCTSFANEIVLILA